MTCLLFIASESARAQIPASVGFKNKTEFNVIVQGTTIVNGQKKLGQPLTIRKGGMAFESNVPPGIRLYTISDAATFRPLLTQQVGVQNRDLSFVIMPHPADPKRIVLVPE